MSTFVLTYQGGSMATTPDEIAASMAAWNQWFVDLGAAVVDGGAPFGAATRLDADGGRVDATTGLSGYSVLTADSLEAAASLAKGCPVLANGGSVEVHETLAM